MWVCDLCGKKIDKTLGQWHHLWLSDDKDCPGPDRAVWKDLPPVR